MRPERQEKVKSLLNSTLQRPVGERTAYLDTLCGDDMGLRREVEYYLNSGDRTARLFATGDPSSGSEPLVDPRLGTKLGKYLIKERLGKGGMGIVYLAVDSDLGREVALKILPGALSQDHDRLSRFQREARATSLLNHPNIVTVFEIGVVDGCEFIVTEFVPGETLRARMQRGPIDLLDIVKIAAQVAGALSATHKAGIIHRDIKPENVMVRPDGYVKVLDFGLAKLADKPPRQTGDLSLSQANFATTVPGMILGTAAYMSPEQAEGFQIDARTDIWGLGVLMYEMAAENLPFEGPTASHTIVAILEQEPDQFECESPELVAIISKALRKDRAERYQSADEMLADIDELKKNLGYVSDQNISRSKLEAANVPAIPARRRSPYLKLLWLLPAAFIALLLVGAAAYGFISLVLKVIPMPDPNRPVVNTSSPTPSPSPTATAPVIVATPSPTPTPTPVSKTTPVIDPGNKTIERPKPTPTPENVRPKPTPKPRPKPTQDPNCVFTNSCH
jgi:serine/threonine protein kinase